MELGELIQKLTELVESGVDEYTEVCGLDTLENDIEEIKSVEYEPYKNIPETPVVFIKH